MSTLMKTSLTTKKLALIASLALLPFFLSGHGAQARTCGAEFLPDAVRNALVHVSNFEDFDPEVFVRRFDEEVWSAEGLGKAFSQQYDERRYVRPKKVQGIIDRLRAAAEWLPRTPNGPFTESGAKAFLRNEIMGLQLRGHALLRIDAELRRYFPPVRRGSPPNPFLEEIARLNEHNANRLRGALLAYTGISTRNLGYAPRGSASDSGDTPRVYGLAERMGFDVSDLMARAANVDSAIQKIVERKDISALFASWSESAAFRNQMPKVSDLRRIDPEKLKNLYLAGSAVSADEPTRSSDAVVEAIKVGFGVSTTFGDESNDPTKPQAYQQLVRAFQQSLADHSLLFFPPGPTWAQRSISEEPLIFLEGDDPETLVIYGRLQSSDESAEAMIRARSRNPRIAISDVRLWNPDNEPNPLSFRAEVRLP